MLEAGHCSELAAHRLEDVLIARAQFMLTDKTVDDNPHKQDAEAEGVVAQVVG